METKGFFQFEIIINVLVIALYVLFEYLYYICDGVRQLQIT